MHTVLLYVRSITFLLVAFFAMPLMAGQQTLLVVGDSLSAAYGVPSETAWVQLLRQRLQGNGLSHWDVVNASISGETTDGGARRLPDLLEKNNPSVVIIELGGNDGLRGFPPNVIKSNLASMVENVQNSGARAILVGMQIPPNYGQRYTQMFADIFPALSDSYSTALVPFFLDGIYDQANLMQGDGIHPTEEAQPKLLENVWPALEPLLE
ncbi:MULTISPECIES: arylesterase [unclassified Marinobacter]|uniref:arylesterase n=1 Tax=unclassified Marinobacter TaxID=83889 RepID=UPI0026E32A0A|nr:MULTISPECIES: arylesterase [unclassified Marinobacter]MDO6442017.1 arylesterase [Marinobacter sp. 2_MG-2023]MDO6825571.1 arylesterase [Marinobacter sp. 1_MG-2023]